jgi:hypothetical protein
MIWKLSSLNEITPLLSVIRRLIPIKECNSFYSFFEELIVIAASDPVNLSG